MKAFLLYYETAEGDFTIGIYSSREKAVAARAQLADRSEVAITEWKVDDPLTHNSRRIAKELA